MSFIGKTEELRKEAGRFARRHCRGICAVLLCVCMVVCGFPSVFFSAFASDDDADYCYELERESLCESLITAVDEGTTFNKELEFYGEYADEYDELFEADGTLYELKNLGYKKDRDRDKVLDLRVFARVGDDIPLEGSYEVSGDEQIIFLLENKSDETVTVTLYVDELETEVIEIVPVSEVGGVIVESAFDASKADVTVSSAVHSVSGGSGRVESDSDAVSGFDGDDGPEQIASLSLKRSNLMTAALDLSDSNDDVVIASASDALRDESVSGSSGSTGRYISSGSDTTGEFISGDIYDAVRLDSKYSAVAFVTTAEALGLDGSISLLASGIMPLADGDTAFAIYSADDNSLTFYYGTEPGIGDAYPENGGKTVTNVYTGFDTTAYTADSQVPWYLIRTSVKTVTFDESFADVKPVAMAYWFYEFTSLTAINAAYLDTSNVTTLECTFYNCRDLVNVEGLDSWDTSNVTTLEFTFFNCNSLTNVDSLANWNTSKVTTLRQTFRSCSSLADVEALANWNTSNVTTLYLTFRDCSSLADVGALANWNTSKVTTLEQMFYGCSNLTEINVSKWDTSNVTNMQNMFNGCRNLETIYSDDTCFVTTSVTSGASMFSGCTSLVGGNGTKYSSSEVSHTMAHVDTASNSGYFTGISRINIYKYTRDIVYDEVYNESEEVEVPLSGAEFELRYVDENDEVHTAWFVVSTGDDGEIVYVFESWEEPVDEEGKEYTQTLISDSYGMIYVEGLEEGTYYLYETKAPAGYSPLTEPVEVVVSANGTGRVSIENNARTILPYTGGPGTVIFEILGVLLIGSALILFMIQMRRKRLTE